MIGIINYDLGNLGSVKNALNKIDEPFFQIDNIADFKSVEKLILPGVGSFSEGIKNIRRKGFDKQIIDNVINLKKPILGICLGMQLLAFKGFEDGRNNGLNLIGGQVNLLKKKPGFSLPHIGWNNIFVTKKNKLMNDIPQDVDFYFVHSYHFLAEKKENILAYTEYSEKINAVVSYKNIYGIQAHPEKSQFYGLKLLKNFCKLC